MKQKLGKILLIGVARAGFDLSLAGKYLNDSWEMLEKLGWQVEGSRSLVMDPDEAAELAASYRQSEADALIFQLSTFADGRYITKVVSKLKLPILLWSLPETEFGGPLRLNSLTGANLAASYLKRLDRSFKFVYRLPSDVEAVKEITTWLKAVRTLGQLSNATIAQIGSAPPGFDTSSVSALRLKQKFGASVVHIEQQEIFNRAEQINAKRCQEILDLNKSQVKGLELVNNEEVYRSTQCYLALRDIVQETNISAVAVRCWPEFFTKYNCAPCSALSHLIEAGIPAACEADVLGAFTMLIQYSISKQPTYLGDLVQLNRDSNTAVFWHCGVGAFSLASKTTGPIAGVQPARKMGFALNNSLKSGKVTIARLGQSNEGFRMLLIGAEAVDTPNTFEGTSVTVRLERPVSEILEAVVGNGFEHHYSIVWSDIQAELLELCRLLELPVTVL